MNGVEVFPIEAIKERAFAGEKLCKELALIILTILSQI